MSRLVTPFIQGKASKTFLNEIQDHQVFGLGISFSKVDAAVLEVRLIVRDVHQLPFSKGFFQKASDKSVYEFFSTFPKQMENPDEGLHGQLIALKIDGAGNETKAMYRRIGDTPVCYAANSFSVYTYSDINWNDFPCWKDRNSLVKFKKETKRSQENKTTIVTYPIYSAIKGDGGLKDGFLKVFGGQILQDEYFDIEIKLDHLKDKGLTPVALGEDPSSIKVYFVDFNREFLRSLL